MRVLARFTRGRNVEFGVSASRPRVVILRLSKDLLAIPLLISFSAAAVKKWSENPSTPLRYAQDGQKESGYAAATILEFLPAAARARFIPAHFRGVAPNRREVEFQIGAV